MLQRNYNFLYGILLGFIASLGWGTVGLWIKPIPLNAVDLTFTRFIISALLFYIFSRPAKLTMKVFVKSAICGVIIAIQLYVTSIAFQALSNGQAVLLTNIHLIFLFLFLTPIFLKRKILMFQIFSVMLLLFYGLFLIFGNQAGIENTYIIIIAISASFFWAVYSVAIEKLFPKNPQEYIFYIFGIGGIIMGVISRMQEGSFSSMLFTPNALIHLGFLLIFSTALSHLCYVLAVKRIGAFAAGTLSYFSILIGFVIDIVIQHQLVEKQIVGVFFAFLALCVLLLLYERVKVKTYV